MQRLLEITICCIVVAWLTNSCTRSERVNPVLEKAEQLMLESPDSALQLLYEIDKDDIMTQADSALYNLLITQAEDKNFIDRTSSDRIEKAVAYYRKYPDNGNKLMLALYYLGRIQENAKLSELSIVSMLEAEQVAIQQKDYFYLGLIYRSIANQYGSIYDFSEQLIYSQKACHAFELSNNWEYLNYEKCNLAVALNDNQKYQEALDTLLIVENKARSYGDSVTVIEAERVMINSYYMLAQYEEAIKCYQDMINNGCVVDDVDKQQLAMIYDKLGDEGMAHKVLSDVSSDYTGPKAALYNIYAQKGDYRNAYMQLQNYLQLTDSTYKCITQQRVTNQVLEFNQDRIKAIKEQNERLKCNVIIAVCIFIVLVIITWILLLIRKKHIEKQNLLTIDALENVASELKKQLSVLQLDHHLMSDELMKMMQKRYNILDDLCQRYYEEPKDANSAKYVKILDQTIDRIRCDADFTSQLLIEFDIVSNQLITGLRQTKSTLKESDFQLLAYLIAGFSNRSISILLCEKIEIVYNRKYHLKGKIAKLDYARKDELLARL
jgi:pentatricopeptide repeat protein